MSNSNITITNSYNCGNILALSNAGGIAGSVKNCEIVNCYNTGNISNMDYPNDFGWAGGILGALQDNATGINETNCKILNSFNIGNISGYSNAGGIISIIRNHNGISKNLQIENCYNNGNLICTNTSNDNEFGNGSSGGIIGEITGNNNIIEISNVYNIGEISGYNYSNGITFSLPIYNNNISITNAYYLNNIKNGVQNIDNKNIIKMTSDDMKQSSFVDILNKNVENSKNKNILLKWKLGTEYPSFE